MVSFTVSRKRCPKQGFTETFNALGAKKCRQRSVQADGITATVHSIESTICCFDASGGGPLGRGEQIAVVKARDKWSYGDSALFYPQDERSAK